MNHAHPRHLAGIFFKVKAPSLCGVSDPKETTPMPDPLKAASPHTSPTPGALSAAPPPATEFITGADPEWRALDPVSPGDPAALATFREAESSIRDELGSVVGAESLVVLAGLGTSLSIVDSSGARCAPTMTDLWEDLKQLPSYSPATPRLNPALLSDANFEHVLSDAQARSALDPGCVELSTFIKAAERLVLERCSFIADDTALPSHETFLRKVARRSTRLQRAQLFTTNYDLAFEAAARNARFNVIDGFGYGGREFDGSSFDLDYVRRRANEQPVLEPNVFHLLKLHGSVDWEQDGRAIKKTQSSPGTPVLIYPSATKYQLSYQQPYLEFMSRLQIALRQPDVGLIVVGFGFNDEHIAAPIQAALRGNIGLRAIVVDPAARAATRSATMDLVEDLIRRGDRRLSILRGTFDDIVRRLPDVPQMEERDAHADRLQKRP